MADWSFDIFTSGSLRHYIARSDRLPDSKTFELFCTNYDSQVTAALFIPEQNQRKKSLKNLNIRVDQGRQWSIRASAHTMSLVSRQTLSHSLLSDLKTGNRVTVTYPLSKDKNTSLRFSLKGSGKALARLEKQCAAAG
ncbi:hypothetical protein ElyMa_001443500 [Elysia marginata]|uniref:Uncharacterized protein n=1 Tax=Elysia marginata TaxID=1093978 RepID=A0AAV4IXQ9_9GAST|nr:hypothetical protein ElyMa_001443500 [Elysia marginata]